MHDVASDETRLVREQENARIGNHRAFGTKSEGMNFIQVARGGSGIGLLGTPLAQHRRPNCGGANGVHPDAMPGVVQRHRFRQRIQATLARGIGRVEVLSDDADEA